MTMSSSRLEWTTIIPGDMGVTGLSKLLHARLAAKDLQGEVTWLVMVRRYRIVCDFMLIYSGREDT